MIETSGEVVAVAVPVHDREVNGVLRIPQACGRFGGKDPVILEVGADLPLASEVETGFQFPGPGEVRTGGNDVYPEWVDKKAGVVDARCSRDMELEGVDLRAWGICGRREEFDPGPPPAREAHLGVEVGMNGDEAGVAG